MEGITFQAPIEGSVPNYFTMALQIDPAKFGCSAEVIQTHLNDINVESKRYFAPILHRTTAYRAFDSCDLRNSEQLAERSLCLPLHTRLREKEIDLICDELIDFHELLRRRNTSKASVELLRAVTSVSQDWASASSEIREPLQHNLAMV